MKRSPISLLVFVVLFVSCATDLPLAENGAGESPTAETGMQLDWLADREVHEPRLILDRAGNLLFVWREKADEGSNIFVALRGRDGQFTDPVRANDAADTVASYPHDEMRPAVATGPGGRLAVAWSDSRGQVRAAESTNGGATFSPAFRLEQVEEASYRGFPELVYDDDGVLHAVWIDSRFAEGFAEEPADLFYARVVDGEVTEWNLTAEQEPTICGCCRPSLEMAQSGALRAVFRNGADGYRDIFTVTGNLDSGFSQPRRIGQPLWKLNGCPMSGPATLAGNVSWADGSTGRKQLTTADFDSAESVPLFPEADDIDWVPRLSPRRVSSVGPGAALLLLPGQAASRLMVRQEDRWVLVVDDLPAWASSGHLEDGALLLIGAVGGEVKMLRRPIEI
ncbi:MAG: hypothetical protein O7A04_08355 [Acidobacteria bacterium]|nr:hypothetical protein [Acidobacteriota bacterium]